MCKYIKKKKKNISREINVFNTYCIRLKMCIILTPLMEKFFFNINHFGTTKHDNICQCQCVCDVRREHDVLIVQSDENDTNIIYIILYCFFV